MAARPAAAATSSAPAPAPAPASVAVPVTAAPVASSSSSADADETDALVQRLMPEVPEAHPAVVVRSEAGANAGSPPQLRALGLVTGSTAPLRCPQITRLSRASAGASGALVVKFSTVSRDPQCERLFDAIGGVLKAAKKRGFVTYAGELLLEGKHDDVEITVLKPVGVPANAPAAKPVQPPARPASAGTPASEAGATGSLEGGSAVQTVARIFSGDPSIDWYGRGETEWEENEM